MKTSPSAIARLATFALLAAGLAQAAATTAVLSVHVSGDGAGSVSSQPPGIDCHDECSARFGDVTVTLTATPDRIGSVFIGWTGACDGIAPQCTVTLDAAKSVEAVFADLGDTVQVIGAGIYQTCALTGAGAVWCWGGNNYGQVGDGTTTNRLMPVPVPGLSSGVQAISVSYIHTCALTSAGAVRCWGSNTYGQLGDGTTTDRSTPVTVAGLPGGVQAIGTGSGHTCALTGTGAAWCWGYNTDGQLGDGTTTDRLTPVAVSSLPGGAQAISAGGWTTCVLTGTGAAWCWGSNADGQIGDGTSTRRLTPVQVSNLSGVQAISTGGSHTCAVTDAGAALCWGYNAWGQLGDGTTTTRRTPVAVSNLSSGVQAIRAGGAGNTCALTLGGATWCWGLNSFGNIGDGTTTNRPTPVAVTGLSSDMQTIGTGYYHACASTAAGAVWCWGRNDRGQLGDGTTTNRPTPVRVIADPVFRSGFD